jgi:hypothetical protein
MIPFSLLWGGFALFWEATVITTKAPVFFELWGVPFVLIGLYLIVGRFFVDARQRQRTIYAVTSERIIIISGIVREIVKSLNLKTLSDISLSEKADGTGTVSLGEGSSSAWLGSGGWPGGRQNAPPAFEGIPNARSVYETIRQAQKVAA